MQTESFSGLIKSLPRYFVFALVFFTRLPITTHHDDSLELPKASQTLPLIGLLLAALGSAILVLLTVLSAPSTVTALFAVFSIVFITGALHEDGLADVADGFGGGQNREAKLLIMKDSRIGAYGVLALIFSVSLKVLILSALISENLLLGCIAFTVAAVGSRLCLLWMWWQLPHAKPDGLSAMVGQPAAKHFTVAAALSTIILLGLMIFAGDPGPFVISGLAGLAATWAFCAFCRRQIQGQTGDTLGAQQQLSELAILFTFLISAG